MTDNVPTSVSEPVASSPQPAQAPVPEPAIDDTQPKPDSTLSPPVTTPITTPVTTPVTTPAPTPHPPTPPKADLKPKSKPRRARPRRRGADSASEDENDAASDNSLSSIPDSDGDESDEEDEDAVEDVIDGDDSTRVNGKPKRVSTFADTSSTTPVAWDDEKIDGAEEITFDEFNRGGTRGRGAARGRGRGRGGLVDGAEKRMYTGEQTRKFEERKAKMKEKRKAKKAELKEKKSKEEDKDKSKGVKKADSGPAVDAEKSQGDVKGKGPKAKGRKKAESNSQPPVSSLVASTSALTIGDTAKKAVVAPPSDTPASGEPSAPTQPRRGGHVGPRGNNREAYAERIANDPKFTPRVGNFWTHDQRHYDSGAVEEGGYSGLRQMSDFWRGRGGPRGGLGGPRGGIRGRGRGGFVPSFARGGGFGGSTGRGQELTQDEDVQTGKGRGRALEMDKLEAELDQARERARTRSEVPSSETAETLEDASTVQAEKTVSPPPQPRESKWGHEGFESMKVVERIHANSMMGRGRGRGRAGFFPRGGLAARGPFAPDLARPQHPSAPPSTNASVTAPKQPSPLNGGVNVNKPTEDLSSQPFADSLFSETSDSVKVKLPGSEEIITAPAAVALQPQTTEIVPNGSAVLSGRTNQSSTSARQIVPPSQAPRAQAPLFAHPFRIDPSSPAFNGPAGMYRNGSAPSPQPFLAGSENGSISSNGHFVPSQPTPLPGFLPPGVGMTQSGAYYNLTTGAPMEFHPTAPSQPARPFYPTNPRAFPAHPHHHSQSSQGQSFYPPQSYSPDHFQPGHPSRGGSFSSPQNTGNGIYFPDGGRSSPYPPYAMGNGFFAPARASAKVSIRAPTTTDGENAEEGGVPKNGEYASIADVQPNGVYYAQHYNPYAAAAGGVGPGQVVSGGVGYDGEMGTEGVYYQGNGMSGMNGGANGAAGFWRGDGHGQPFGAGGGGGGGQDFGYGEYPGY